MEGLGDEGGGPKSSKEGLLSYPCPVGPSPTDTAALRPELLTPL